MRNIGKYCYYNYELRIPNSEFQMISALNKNKDRERRPLSSVSVFLKQNDRAYDANDPRKYEPA